MLIKVLKGFCTIEYETQEAAEEGILYMDQAQIDGNFIRCETVIREKSPSVKKTDKKKRNHSSSSHYRRKSHSRRRNNSRRRRRYLYSINL